MRRGGGTLYFGIAATVFFLVHLPWAWTAFTGERTSFLPDDLAVHRFEWAVTLFVVPLLTAAALRHLAGSPNVQIDPSAPRGGEQAPMSLKKTHRIGAAFVAVVGLLLLSGASALANGPLVAKVTERLVNEVTTDIGVHPCTGQAAELTLVETGVIHFSAFADGTVHFTGTLRGTLSADALPADGIPEATGTFVHWFGGNGMLLEEGGALGTGVGSFTLNGRGTNADGSTFSFHEIGHTVFDTDGVPKLDFSKVRANCP